MTRVIDTYELSPLQAGILFRALSSGNRDDYVEQLVASFSEPLDEASFVRAWQRVVERHPALRSRLRWERLAQPLQEVLEGVELPITRLDWRGLAAADRHERFKALQEEHRLQGFDLEQAPLMKLVLVRASDREHWMVWTFHHVILDGYARLLLLREVSALYQALLRGEEIDLPLPRPYRNFIEWLRDVPYDDAKAYWQDALGGFRAPTPLIVTRTRSTDETAGISGARSGVHEARLPAEITSGLRKRAREAMVTLNMLLQGAWALLLHRYSGESDIVFGVTRNGRGSAIEGAREMIGLLINTLPVRIRVDAEAEFVPWLHQLRARHMAVRSFEQTPLVKVQAWSQVPPGTPLFRSIFVFENETPATQFRSLGEPWSRASFLTCGQTEYPLVLSAYGEGRLLLRLQHSRSHFDDATVARMMGHLETLLEGIATIERPRLKDLPLLSERERLELRRAANQGTTYRRSRCLHERFEEQVERAPDAVALFCDGQQLTYAELNRRANRLARHLRRLGVAPEVLVGLRAERGIEMVVGILAILKAGGAYLPLDPAYPKDRLAFMLEDSGVRVIVTQRPLTTQLEGIAVTQVLLDEPPDGDETNLSPAAAPDNLAYVIYTSGSTGKPKGALITHYNVVRLFEATEAWYRFDRHDVWALFHSYAFDFSVWELWGALLYGGRVVIIPYWTSRSAEEFRELLIHERVTVLNQTPSAFRQLLQVELSRPQAQYALRYVIFGGEALELQSLRPWFERYGDDRPLLVNMYGITETTVHVTYRPIRRRDLDCGQGSVIGAPIPDLQVHILDPHGQPVPIGVPGEMYVGGAGVARGYLARPELTAQRFINDPFMTAGGAKLYRSGDLARRLENGDIEYLGRIDHQVKIRGFRIELGEIEAAIARHPAIREVAVMAREDSPGDRRLVAYVVAETQEADLTGQVRALVRDSLPEYMVPGHFIRLDSLPLTENGKIDRKALPAPDTVASPRAACEPPRTPTEAMLAGIWSEVLGVERLGVHDNFFELGGHSLLAMQVVSRVRLTMSAELPLRDLFEAPTVALLARRVDALPVPGMPPLLPAAQSGAAQLSFSQQRLWFLDQIEPGGAAYVVAEAFELRGALDARALEQALNALPGRHDALRTVFVSTDGRPSQVVQDAQASALSWVDLGGEADAPAALAALLREEAGRGFDLERGPLFRARCYRLAHDRHVLLLAMHHIVSDGWSLDILLADLGKLYGALRRREPAPPADSALTYRHFARWQRACLEGEVLEGLLASWRRRLEGAAQVLELPADRPRAPQTSGRGAIYSFALSSELTERLRELARREGATLFMMLLAGFNVLLSRYSGQDDFLVGTPVANRSRRELEDVVGCFVNTLVLRADLSGNPSTRELLARVREMCLDAIAHQDLPLDLLVEAMRPQRQSTRNPLFQVMFVLQNAPRALELEGIAATAVDVDRGATHVELSLAMQEADGALRGSFEYATDLFEEATIARMAAHLRLLLEAMAASPEFPVCELPLLSASERRRLLQEWNGPATQWPSDALMHGLFEAQAAHAPDAVAVVCRGRKTSYGELDRRADRLARALAGRGVGPDVLVALCVTRGLDMIVALLGILKAGGAYVPLDPEYPPERLAFMLGDCGARFLVTEMALYESIPCLSGVREVLCLDRDAHAPAGEGPERPRSRVDPSNLAYAIYTSGSTGQPKAALLTHRGLANLALSEIGAYGIEPRSRVLQFSSLSFDASLSEIAMALCSGASLYVEDRDTLLPGADLERYLERESITVLSLTPSALAMLDPAAAPALEQVIVGGEACPLELALRWASRCRFINTYGPTETAVTTTCVEYRDGVLPPVIGRPLPNVRVYLLDRALQPVPVGVRGEIFIGGIGVALGYLNRPGLTAERFVHDPFAGAPAALMYRSGDYGRWSARGQLEFLGRADDQVKLRGFRIELGEIEAALGEHASVREAAVVVRDDTKAGKRLVAYVTAAGAAADLPAQLRAFVAQRLPGYMVPAQFVVMEAFPLTANGKLDRRALPPPSGSAGVTTASGAALPRTDTEAAVMGVFREVLERADFGVFDDFFDLGGHSLMAARLVSRLRAASGRDLPLRSLLEHRSVAGLAGVIEQLSWLERAQEPVGPAGGREELEL